ncbi:MAG TPA: serine/threonine-protein kinase, partial [Chthoniobacteraceae bacterium]|nr:serine/threonine-protein kinase [Chthoniobacteraceae bacterium]
MKPTEGSPENAGQTVPPLSEVTAAFPHLEVIELIGQGGMGCVFKARQPRLNRLVALKLLPSSLAQRDPAFAGRFEREGQLLARLHHPNIVAVHDSGTAGEFFFLIMEYVDGVNLRQAMRARRFTAQQALAIVPLICDALQYAHDEGVLHRDIKPENILLDAKGRVKLADFGIAKLVAEADLASTGSASAEAGLTHASATLGTPSYMAPEQRESPNDIDHRADIYSLGVVFYELLTGELPRERFTPPSASSEADPRVDPIVRQALEKDRDLRQRSAGEVRTQLTSLDQGKAAPGRGASKLRLALAIVMLILAIVVPLTALGRLDDSIRLRAAEHSARIKQEQQHATALSNQLANTQANAGRAASRAGNSALPEEFRKEARQEQEHFEAQAGKVRIELALVQARLSEVMATRADVDWRSLLPILLKTLPFVAGGLFLLAQNGNTRAAFVAAGVLLVLILACIAFGQIGWGSPSAVAKQPLSQALAPRYSSITSNHSSVYLAHDDVELHYAMFYRGEFSTSNSGGRNRHGRTWLDESAIKLAGGRTFGLRRDSANDLYLTINGAEYDLRHGRLFVLRDDGKVAQQAVHPSLQDARSLETLGKLAGVESSGDGTASMNAVESWSYT